MIPSQTPDAEVQPLSPDSWKLSIQAGEAGRYRCAQLDDYHRLPRRKFGWRAPAVFSLRARASAEDLPGTWGFGLWNDPFGAGIAHGGLRLLPALPNAAWFFFASEPNYLSFREDVPAVGKLAGVFRAPGIPAWVFVPFLPAAPLLGVKPFSRLARRGASKIVSEEAVGLDVDVTAWHEYRLVWTQEGVCFEIDGQVVARTTLAPRGPLGLVIWLDNQYAAWRPDGGLSYGTLETGSGWIEIQDLRMQ
jgi:hypothetical protein